MEETLIHNPTFGRSGIEKHLGVIHFKGGSAPKAPPPPDPPVTERRTEVIAAERTARLDARKRKGQRASVFAGETGGYGLNDTAGGNGLLG